MINQPFVQTVWFVFIGRNLDYTDIDWENITNPIKFYQEPVGVYSSKKDIWKTMDLESKESREKTKNNIKHFQKAKGDNSTSISMLQKIIDTEHIWRQISLQRNNIQFIQIDPTRDFDHELPTWLKSKRITTMEIWEDRYYYNKIHDASDVYCFMEVVL